MTTSRSRGAWVTSAQGAVNAIWPYIGGKRGLIVLGFGIAVAGMAMNWGWLVAMGLAPILLAVLPCAAMCAIGLCMKKGGDKSCSAEKGTVDDAASPRIPPSPSPPSVAANAGRTDLGPAEAEPRSGPRFIRSGGPRSTPTLKERK